MKKLFVHFFTLALALTWVSCQKNKDDIQPPVVNQPPAGSKIKTRTVGASVITYEYNGAGNVIKASTAGKAFPDYTYDYNGNTINMKHYQADGSVSEDVTIILNAKGLAIEHANALTPAKTFKYEYDDQLRMVKLFRYINGTVDNFTSFTYKEGNMVNDSTFNSAGNYSHGRDYEYIPGIISTTEYDNFGESFWGIGNKNALKKVTYKNVSEGITGTQVYLPHELDNKFRISKSTYQTNGTGTPIIREYTYY